MEPKYVYRATVERIVDGDTIDVNLDLGLGVWLHKQRLRLVGINTPEVRGPEREAGLAASAFVEWRIHGQPVIVKTFKDKKGKYGRWLAEVYYENQENVWVNLNEELVREGHAVRLED